jgi:hypothetical protein
MTTIDKGCSLVFYAYAVPKSAHSTTILSAYTCGGSYELAPLSAVCEKARYFGLLIELYIFSLLLRILELHWNKGAAVSLVYTDRTLR